MHSVTVAALGVGIAGGSGIGGQGLATADSGALGWEGAAPIATSGAWESEGGGGGRRTREVTRAAGGVGIGIVGRRSAYPDNVERS